MNRINKGFSLIELMVSVAIVGILVSIAYPSYREHIRTGARSDAQGALVSLANAMARWHIQNNSYTGATASDTDRAPTIFATRVPTDGSGTTTYNLTIEAATADTFTLRATPTGSQQGDGNIELDETGVRSW